MMGIIGNALGSIYQVMRGLKTVAQHTFRPPTTQEYPEAYPDLPATFRGRLALTVNPESGEHLCISCRQCERVCPDKCIEITAHKSPETNKLELIDFKIDHGLCMFCGLCTEVCPTNCIINTQDMEMSDYSRDALVYDLRKLTLSQEESSYYFEKKELPLPKPKPAKPAPAAAGAAGAAKPAAGAAAAAKPAPAPGAEKPGATPDSASKAGTPAEIDSQKAGEKGTAAMPEPVREPAPGEPGPAAGPPEKPEMNPDSVQQPGPAAKPSPEGSGSDVKAGEPEHKSKVMGDQPTTVEAKQAEEAKPGKTESEQKKPEEKTDGTDQSKPE